MQLATSISSGPVQNALAERQEQIARQFSRSAHRYDRFAAIQVAIARQAMTRLAPASGEALLDLGCGTGLHTHALATDGHLPVGADLAPGMVSYARERYPQLPFVVADAQMLPFSNVSFAQIFSSMALQWCAQPLSVLKELHRVLRPGGRAVLAIMVDGSFTELEQARSAAGLSPSVNPHHSHGHWCVSAQQAGFSLRFAECQEHVDTHADILALLASIKKIGAATQVGSEAASSLTRNDLQQLERAYREGRAADAPLPLTYRVSHLTLEK